MSKIPGTALIRIDEEKSAEVKRPKLKNIVDAFDGGKTFDEGLTLAAANFSGKAAGFTENPVEFLRPYATRLVASGALVWEQTAEEIEAGLTIPTPAAARAPKLDEDGNVIEKPKRERKKKAKAEAEAEENSEAEASDSDDELPEELSA